MNQKKLKIIKEVSVGALAFLIPFILLIILFSANGFGIGSYESNTIIMIDMKSQYIAYLRDYRNLLLNNGSLIYTTSKAFGGDYMSLYDFYLGSPFNFFVVFFEESALPLFFLWSSLLKMAFASLNFYFLMRFSDKFNYNNIIFAIGYGLISYSFVYLSNFMWLDGVMILPLVALGIHFVKEKKQYWLYPLALGYSLMTSWYIGFMVAMFAVAYFVYEFIMIYKKKDIDKWKFTLRFAVFSLLGGFISSIFWMTAFLHLSGTKGFSDIPPFKTFSLSMFISGLLENNYSQVNLITQYNSYLSMFVGIVPLVFFITFFFNKEFKLKERLALLGLFLIYFFFSLNSITTALLHGGKEPTWFPGRYSFVIGFLVAFIGAKSLNKAHKLHPLYYLAPLGIGLISLLILAFTTHSERMSRYTISVPSLVMFIITIIVGASVSFFYRYPVLKKIDQEKLRKYLPYALFALIAVQIASSYRGADNVLKVNNAGDEYQTYEEYLEDDSYTSSFNKIKEYDNSPFYRMESTFNRPNNYNQIDNNPMFYSYSGLSNFSSSGKKNVESYLTKIGFHYNNYFTKYDGGSTYAMNSLLGIKYLLEDKECYTNIHPYFLDYDTFTKLDLTSDKNVDYYYNPNAINLAFTSDKTSATFINEGTRSSIEKPVYWFDHFEYQNSMFKTFTRSINKNVFYPLEVTSFSTSIAYTEDEYGIKTYTNVKKGDTITIQYKLPYEKQDFPLYFSEKNYTSDIYYIMDGRNISINTYWHKGIYSFKDTTTHNHTLRIAFQKDRDKVTIRPEVYYEDLDILKEYLTKINEQEFVVNRVNNSLTKKEFIGSINITDNNKDLIFTLPYEDGIKVYVDGKRVETMLKCNIFTAISLNELSLGNHEVIIQYQDNTLVLALPVFFVSILGFVPLVIFYPKIEDFIFKKRKKEETK